MKMIIYILKKNSATSDNKASDHVNIFIKYFKLYYSAVPRRRKCVPSLV